MTGLAASRYRAGYHRATLHLSPRDRLNVEVSAIWGGRHPHQCCAWRNQRRLTRAQLLERATHSATIGADGIPRAEAEEIVARLSNAELLQVAA
jgi:hypothetical protein